jgi:intein/homing endonuclease
MQGGIGGGAAVSRIALSPGAQRKFLDAVKASTGSSWDEIAKGCGICERSLRDWRHEKYKMSLEAAEKLALSAKIPIPDVAEILPEFWSCSKAGQISGEANMKKYGNPGTPEGRRKGGQRAQDLRRKYPERYPLVGKRKTIRISGQSPLLAEFVGIMIGDGNVSNHQIRISMNHESDRHYADFIAKTIEQLFDVTVSRNKVRKNTCTLVATGMNLVEYLIDLGLPRGDKIKQQVKIPPWILERPEFKMACLRGLMDTDGSVYYHRHKSGGINYCHIGICFTSYCQPLLESVSQILDELGFAVKNGEKHISLYRKREVRRYFELVSSHNPKHLQRCWNYFNGMVE